MKKVVVFHARAATYETLADLRRYLALLRGDRQARLGNTGRGLTRYIDTLDGILRSDAAREAIG